MVATPLVQPLHQPAWSGGVLCNGVEFPRTILPILSGKLPATLQGTLYRNGPAHFTRSGQRVGHWFDGDGAILAVNFDGQGATGLYRYVWTKGYAEELAQEQLLYGGYGTLPNGSLPQKIGRHVKHVANTGVLPLGDRLLALWEVGQPYVLDADSLQTQGLDDLGLSQTFPYSAHPKRDDRTGEIFNFGLSYHLTHATLNLYRSDASGQIQQHRQHRLPHIGYVHDIALAGRYLVVALPPIEVQTLPHLALLQKPVSECMTWRPERGSQIWIFDRHTLKLVRKITTEPWFHWHFGNAYEAADGTLVLSVIRYEDFQTNLSLREMVNGTIQTPSNSSFWELRLDVNAGRVLEFQPLWQRACEMPIVQPHQVGKANRYTYMISHRRNYQPGEWFRTIARYDHNQQRVIEADLGESCYPSEPIYAPHPEDPDRGWILSVVYDGHRHQSEVWIFDAAGLDADPICCLGLPEVIPLSFHGAWQGS